MPLVLEVRESGYILAPCIVLMAMCWTIYGAWALVRASIISGEPSYERLAKRSLGLNGGYFVQFVIVLNSFALCTSVMDLFATIVLSQNASVENLKIIGGLALMVPVAVLRKMEYLAYLSYATFTSVVVFLGFVIARCAEGAADGTLDTRLTPGPNPEKVDALFLQAFAKCIFSFVCQFNVSFASRHRLHVPSPSRLACNLACSVPTPMPTPTLGRSFLSIKRCPSPLQSRTLSKLSGVRWAQSACSTL